MQAENNNVSHKTTFNIISSYIVLLMEEIIVHNQHFASN